MNKALHPPKRFWRILKFIGIGVAIILSVFGTASWIVFDNKNEWLLIQLQSYLMESQSGQLKITSIDLKLFRNFPDVTVALGGVDYYEHRDSVRTPEEKPILHVDQAFVAFEFLPLINDELKVSEITLSKGQLNIAEYKNGLLNINHALAKPTASKAKIRNTEIVKEPAQKLRSPVEKKQSKPDASHEPDKIKPKPQEKFYVDLQYIDLTDILLTWSQYNNPHSSVILVNKLEASLLQDENALSVNLTSSLTIQSFLINKTKLPSGDLKFNADLNYEGASQKVTVQQGKIDFDVFSATVSGSYTHKKNQMLDVQIDASSNDLALLSLIIKPEVLKKNPGMLKQGDIYVKGRVFGELKNRRPQLDVSFGVDDLTLTLPDQRGTFKDVGFKGRFKSGRLSNYSRAMVEVRNLKGELPGGFVKGDFSLNNFIDPYMKYDLEAQLKLDGYDQIFQIDFLKELRGSVSLRADFDGPFKFFAEHRMDSSRSSSITFDDLSFLVPKTNQRITGLSGKIENKYNQATIQQLTLRYGKNDLLLNATVDNLVYFLIKKETSIVASGNLKSDQIFTKDFIMDTLKTAQVQDRISNLSLDFHVKTSERKLEGDSLLPDIAFTINNLTAKLDKLADINRIDTKGVFSETASGLKLTLEKFNAVMPQGKLDVTGDLFIPEEKLWTFHARVKANRFPWTYIKDLIAEIKDGSEPSAKNLPVKEMDIFTGDLDLSSTIVTYPFDFNKLDVRDSRIEFEAAGSKKLSVERLNLALDNLHFIHPENSGSITGLKSTRGTLELKQLSIPGLNKLNINMDITGENDSLDIAFSSATQMAKSEHGKLLMDISKKDIAYRLNYNVHDANLEYFIKQHYKKKFMSGDIDYVIDLHSSGSDFTEVKKNLAGSVQLTGDSIILYGADIDKMLKKYERSQKFNLTDLGAILVAGPIGLAITKGSDFVSLATIHLDSTKRTRIQKLMASWKLEGKQLSTEDVAFATPMNRLAFNVQIDFGRDSIPGLTIAVVDKNGCALMDQKLHGKFGDLKTGKLNVAKTLFGSVINFVNAVVGKDCKPVYSGVIQDPLQVSADKTKKP